MREFVSAVGELIIHGALYSKYSLIYLESAAAGTFSFGWQIWVLLQTF